MDIDLQMDSLHLSGPCEKRRRLSGYSRRIPSLDDNISSSPEPDNMPALAEESVLLDEPQEKPVRRSGRKTNAPVRWDGQNSTSRNMLSSNNLAAIEKYYLDTTVKRTTTSLETIFEEGQVNKTKMQSVMSVRKLRRSINFCDTMKANPGRIRKRKTKAMKINAKNRLSIKCTVEDLLKKLSSIEKDTNQF